MMVMNGEYISLMKQVVVAYLKALCRILLERPKKATKKFSQNVWKSGRDSNEVP
jgi:hypothetical protein